jgi:hypothetical protein
LRRQALSFAATAPTGRRAIEVFHPALASGCLSSTLPHEQQPVKAAEKGASMNRYLVSYDLLTPGKRYHELVDALTRLGATRVLLSEWVVRSNSDSKGLRDYLRKFVDTNDRLLVNKLDETDWASINLMAQLNGAYVT